MQNADNVWHILIACIQSHDYNHILRVVAVALSLAKEENVDDTSVEIVHIAALLHDVKDWKYSGDEQAGKKHARAILEQLAYPADKTERVITVIESVGFKDEINADPYQASHLSLEARIVQDADRLDAIGAIGIARCFTFGGARGRALYNKNDLYVQPGTITEITSAEYKAQPSQSTQSAPSTLQHFSDKLFKLKSMMKTQSGALRASQRHEFMLNFVTQFQNECLGVE